MVAIMTMTPVHMRDHHHGLSDVGLVIGIHIAAMYLPSLLTGILVDRVGRTPMAIAAGSPCCSPGWPAPLRPSDSLGLLILVAGLARPRLELRPDLRDRAGGRRAPSRQTGPGPRAPSTC